jgi:hypothetical protein
MRNSAVRITSVILRLHVYVHAIAGSTSRVDLFAVYNEMTITTLAIQEFVTVASVPSVAVDKVRPNLISSQIFLVSFRFLFCVYSTCSEVEYFVSRGNYTGSCKHPEFSPCKVHLSAEISDPEEDLGVLNYFTHKLMFVYILHGF